MTMDERTLRESLATYANGVVVTVSDVERLQTDLRDRLGPRRPPHRRRLLTAAAAVLLLVAGVVAGTLWLRRPPAPVPPDPGGLGPLPAIMLDTDETGSNLTAVRPDHTLTTFRSARDIVHPLPVGWTVRWRVDGNTMIADAVDPQGLSCHGSWPWRVESDGLTKYDTAVLDGPACNSTAAPPATSTRLSPVSQAGRNLKDNGSNLTLPVIDPVQLNGVWLLQGTGLLLAADEVTNNGADYLLDDDGDIDVAPDAKGRLAVTSAGEVTMTSSGCAETTLGHIVMRGTSLRRSLTMIVSADPCNRFGGRSVLTWIQVL